MVAPYLQLVQTCDDPGLHREAVRIARPYPQFQQVCMNFKPLLRQKEKVQLPRVTEPNQEIVTYCAGLFQMQ